LRNADGAVYREKMGLESAGKGMSRCAEVESLISFVARSVDEARAVERPFFHLEFDRVFPNDIYGEMLQAMPNTSDYRRMSGRRKEDVRDDGTPTRVKIDLFPEYIRGLPAEKRAVWEQVGRALCSREVQAAFVRRLEPGLSRRFGDDFADVDLYPVPTLTRDVPGYKIAVHSDTHWKGITVQLYLPRDDAHGNIGTLFHERLPDGSLTRTQMRFAPNTGYAFAVADNTLHSADPVGPEVDTRDSILLTYFVDAGLMRFVRNRGKRLGNFVLNEARSVWPQ
jgi:hypothetical protein